MQSNLLKGTSDLQLILSKDMILHYAEIRKELYLAIFYFLKGKLYPKRRAVEVTLAEHLNLYISQNNKSYVLSLVYN